MEQNNIIRFHTDMSWNEKQRLIEFALWKGFHAMSAQFPIISRTEGEEVPKSLKECREICGNAEKPEGYVSSSEAAKPVPEFDWRSRKGLENLFEKGMFLKDHNLDMLPDRLDFKIALPQDAEDYMVIAAANIAFRFGMETTGYEGPIVADEHYKGNRFIIQKEDTCGLRLEETEEGTNVYLYGHGEELEEFSAWICEKFPLLPNEQKWSDALMELTDSFAMKNLDGQISYLKAFENDLGEDIEAFVSPEAEEYRKELETQFPNVKFENYKGRKKVYEKEYDIPWEVDICRRLLEEKVYANLNQGDTVRIYGALSEESDVRHSLTNEIEKAVTEKGASLENAEIICAYKQGFSWIDEIVIPQLKGRNAVKLNIAFRPFLPEGETDWHDEDGAIPSYTNLDFSNPNKWYDLPIRYLQELYPITDMIGEKLGIEKENIVFSVYEGDKNCTYLVKAEDTKGDVIYEADYLAANAERPYLDIYPEMGKVHPSTGYVKAYVNDEEVLNERVQTDVERIWDIYQKEVLKDLQKFIENKLGNQVSLDTQPFFSRLELKVTASEPNYRLSCREDMISSLNSLHEDMYFVGADFFKNYGARHSGEILDAPGLILPILKKGDGKPHFQVTLYDVTAKEPMLVSAKTKITALAGRGDIQAFIRELTYEEGEVTAHVCVSGGNAKVAEAYSELFNKGMLTASRSYSGIKNINLNVGKETFIMNVPEQTVPDQDLDIREIDLLENTLIGYEEYLSIMEQLKRVRGISVFQTAVSYEGRKIYAVELKPDRKGYVSRIKKINALPSEIINSRHHANEVSSTNSAFMLLKELLTNPKYEGLSEKMNLVIVPMENVDGSVIHYELQKENPNWKFHVARFNAIGKEFYHEHFKEDTIHTEAMGLTKLWYRFLPDIMVDNHGVPSHEWEQQFSGYTSPSFKGFWLPRSLLYGYFWYVTDEAYKGNYSVNKKMEDVIADAIGTQEDVCRWNKEWIEQFEKFAHGWLPKLFPANYYKDMINYWIPFAYDAKHRYPSIRFPWITTVAYTSEVADETAQGEYLHLCAKAHMVHDLAAIDMIVGGTSVFETKEVKDDHYVSICCIRQRPMIV